jgi:hypothetical protein
MGFRLSVLALPGDWSLERLIELRVCGPKRLDDVARDDLFYPAEQPSIVKVGGHTCVFWFGFYERFVTGKEDAGLEERLLGAIGGERAYYFCLVSTINLYALLVWQDGRRTRRLVGWSDELNFDDGAPLSEEARERERFAVEKGEGPPRYRDRATGELYSHDQVGESFVFAASAAVFGVSLFHDAGVDPLPAKLPRHETWDAYRARVH